MRRKVTVSNNHRNQLLRNEIDLILSHKKELNTRMNEFRAIQVK